MPNLKRLPFGQFAPDLAPILNGKGLTVARNMLPKAGGYRSMRGLANIAGTTALTARPRGSISGTTSGGGGYLYAGDGTTLYENTDAGMTDRSRSGGYVLGSDHRWSFAKYFDRIFAVTPNDEMQQRQIGGVDLFANVEGAPRARHLAVVDEFLMAGNIYDPREGSLPEDISWSSIRNPLQWPVPGSNEAVATQAGRQPLEGGWGWVQDIVAGAEVGAVFQERAVWRLDHVGGREVFRIKRVENEVGMLVAHSGVAFERKVFYIAEDGFRAFDYTGSVNIGKERINRTFLADLDSAYFDRVWVNKDPDETLVWIAYPGAGNTAGRPNKLIFYDYALDRFSEAAIDLEALIQNVTESEASIDADESLPDDPDDLGDPGFENPGGTAGYGDTSFDDRGAPAGASQQGAFDTSFTASSFTGDRLQGVIETGDIEFTPGYRSFLEELRPLVDGAEASCGVGVISARRDSPNMVIGRQIEQDEDGKCPFRHDGRYHRVRVECEVGWDDAIGFDYRAQQSGDR